MTEAMSLLETATTLAREAGELVMAGRATATVAATKSSDVDIVTQVDLASEDLLRRRIAQLRPDDGILGEEGDDVVGSSGITWVLDPIDGTVNYAYGSTAFGVSVAAVEGPPRPREWTALAGAFLDGSGTLWTAALGHGAWRDGIALHRSGGPSLPQTLVATGFQYRAEARAVQGRIVAELLPRVRDIRRLGSAALDLCQVAAGMVDAYYEHGTHAWDFAAGALIASEAGVRVASFDGGAPDERLVIAAPPDVWEVLRDALAECGVERLWDDT